MKRRPLFIASGIIAIAAAIAAAGCGGSGTQTSVAPITAAAANTAQATLSIVIPPASTTSSSSRGTEYVSPSTGSVSFQLPSMANPTVVAVGPNVSGCTGTVGTGYTCTASFSAPLGASQVLTVKTYANSTGTGSVLAQGTTTISVTATGPNSASVTLNGVVASIALSSSGGTTVTVGTPGTTTITWSAKDASGNTIIAPGTLIDATGAALATPSPSISPSADSSAFSIGSYSGTATGGSWVGTYNGGAATSPMVITASVTNSGVTAGTLSITVNPAPTASPSASPTASPSPSPTATATAVANAVTDGDFTVAGTGSNSLGSPWYTCAFNHTALSAPINAYPSPSPTPQAVTNPTASPFPSPGTTPVAQLETAAGVAGALTTPPPSADTNFAMVESSISVSGAIPKAFKGAVGICQDVTVPAGTPSLYVQVYEGGDDSFADTDTEADLFTTPVGAPHSDGVIITTAPLATLFAEDNCWDSAAQMPIFLPSPYGTGTVTLSATSRWSNCPETPGVGPVPSGFISLGGFWYSRVIPIPAGQTGGAYTVFLGVWRNAGSSAPTTSAAGYYSYAYFSAVGIH